LDKIAEVLERLAALEATVAKIGHNGGPPLDEEPPKRSPGLLPDRFVAERYGVSVRTLERWDKQPKLGFPSPVRINKRRYRKIAKLDEFDRKTAAQAKSRNRVRATTTDPSA
jgi:hypothetical protein